MFAFKRPKVVNSLTQLLNNNHDATVKEVLSNNDLSASIRNEVPELLDYFCPPLPDPPSHERKERTEDILKIEKRQEELALLVFTSKLNRKDEPYEDDLFFRFNRNASNIVSSPSKKFHDRLIYYYLGNDGKEMAPSPFFEQLIKFARSINGSKPVHHQSVFYGHFHRVFEAIVRSTKGEFFTTFYKLAGDLNPFYKVVLKEISLTSIRQLYVTCSTEYPAEFAGKQPNSDEKPSDAFIDLAEFGKSKSAKIAGTKVRRVRKVHVSKEFYDKTEKDLKSGKKLTEIKVDLFGNKQKITYISEEEAKKKMKPSQSDNDGNTKKKMKDRYHYFQLTVASLLTIRDIINDSTEILQCFQKDNVIEDLLIIGNNIPESSFALSLAYNLIIRISTFDKGSINEFRSVLDKKQFVPDFSKIDSLRARLEDTHGNDDNFDGERLIYQLPLYLSKVNGESHTNICDLFFDPKKYSEKFNSSFVYTIKHVLSKEEKINFLTYNDNYFLDKLCQSLPDYPKLVLKDYSPNQEVDPELPSIEGNTAPQDLHKPLRGFIWDIADYICNEKHFTNDDLEFKAGDDWAALAEKVDQYNQRVYGYVDRQTEEEEDQIDGANLF